MSDKADGIARDTYLNFSDEAADRSGSIIMKMLDSFAEEESGDAAPELQEAAKPKPGEIKAGYFSAGASKT